MGTKAHRKVMKGGRQPKFDASPYPKTKERNVTVIPFKTEAKSVGDTAPDTRRWRAALSYSDGWREVFFEEIEELHDIIEQGPDWNTLVSCVVTLNQPAA